MAAAVSRRVEQARVNALGYLPHFPLGYLPHFPAGLPAAFAP
jgi:hypothetical protein